MKLWIARQKSGRLIISDKELKLCHDMYYDGGFLSETMRLPDSEFPEVTFENSPQQVELKLVSEIIGITESPSKTFPRVNEFEVGASYRR